MFNPRYRAYTLPEGVVLLGESETMLLRGRAYVAIAPLVDGRRSRTEIVARVGGVASADTIREAFDRMERHRYIVEAVPPGVVLSAAERFWQSQGVDRDEARARVGALAVHVETLGGIDAEPCRTALRGAGLRLGEPGDAGLTVLLTDDYARAELAAHNAEFLRWARPWLLARPVGETVWLGPLFLPGTTGCWECLRQRLELHRRVDGLLRRRLGDTAALAPAAVELPPGAGAIYQLLAASILRWVVQGGHPGVTGRVVTLSLLTLETRTHVLTRLPQCPACGDPARWTRAPEPFVPVAVAAPALDDGGTRSLRPEAFITKVEPHISPVTGIVPELIRIGDPASPAPVYSAGYNLAFMCDDLQTFRLHLRRNAAGKGSSDVQARASALGEAIERHSGVFQGYEPIRWSRYQDIREDAVHPQLLTGFSALQYAGRQTGDARRPTRSYVPPPLDEGARVAWSPVWSLTQHRVKYVPTAFCYYGFPAGPEAAGSCCIADSNGCACGATREEAFVQGLLELVERDAVAIWWYNRLRRPGIDLDAVADPHVAAMAEHLLRLGLRLWALDLTTDIGIPVVAAVGAPVREGDGAVAIGLAAHFDVRIALRRAVNECGQMVAAFDLLRRTEGLHDDPTVQWLEAFTQAREPYLQPDPRAGHGPQRTGPGPCDGRDAIAELQGRLEALGLEVLILDQTRPDLDIPVVKAVVPGLRHFWPRFGPGRLYEVPVRMGWLSAAVSEQGLNPLPMVL